MRIEQLKYLLEVAKTHSVSIAANNLFISQSTISDAIKKLEIELNVSLFERSKQGMYLTEVGQAICVVAENIQDEIKTIVQLAQESQNLTIKTLEGQLNIGTSFYNDYHKLLATLADFQETYPKIKLKILEDTLSVLLERLEQEKCDIALVYVSSAFDEKNFADTMAFKTILNENFYILVRADNKLAHKSSITLKEIAKYPLSVLCFNDLAEEFYGEFFRDVVIEGGKINTAFQTNNIQLLQNYILQHNAVGFALGETTLKNIVLEKGLTPIKIADKMKIKQYFVYKRDSSKLDLIEGFWAMLQEKQ